MLTPSQTPRYATTSAATYNDTTARLYVAGGKTGNTQVDGFGYIEFVLQSATHRLEDHVNVVEGVDDAFGAYAFGAKAPMFSYSGVFLNNKQDDQARNFEKLYWESLRAWKAAQKGIEVCLSYGTVAVFGTLINLSTSLRAPDESTCPFQFTLLVREFKVQPSGTYGPTPTTPVRAPVSASRKPTKLLVVTSGVHEVVTEEPEPEPEPPPPAPDKGEDAEEAARALAEARGDNLKVPKKNGEVVITGSGQVRYLHNGEWIYMKESEDGESWIPLRSTEK